MINTSELTQTISQTAVKKKLPKGVRQWIEVAPFILVGLILVCVFIIYPEIKSIWMSFLDYNVMDESKSVFIGFKNYLRAFVGNDSQYFYLAFRNVLLYALVTIPVGMLLGLIMAVLTNGVKHGQLFFRSMLYLPVLIDWIIVGTIFLYLFQDGQSGLINYYMDMHMKNQDTRYRLFCYDVLI